MRQLALMAVDDWDKPDPTQLPPPPGRVVWERPGKEGATERVLFIQAAPHPGDPTGLIRWIVQQPDGRWIPRHAVAADELDTRHLHAVPDPEDTP